MRVAVVGAGIVGCACALFLQRDGHEVTLLDPRPPGAGTSSGNAGVISLSSLLPLATPGLLRKVPGYLRDPVGPLRISWPHLPRLVPWLVRLALNARAARAAALAEPLGALLDRADLAHDLVIQQCGLADLVRPGGWLKVAYDRDRLLAATAADRAAYDRRGRRYRLLDAGEVRDLEPALSPEVRAGLLLEANRAVRDPRAHAAAIARTVLERGGRHVRASVAGLVPAEGGGGDGSRRVGALALEGGAEEPAEAVVLAAGAFSGRLARAAGARVPLEAERGYHLMLPHPEPTLGRPIYTVEGAFVVAPMAGGLRLTGGVELASLGAPPDFARIRRLLPVARRLLPGLGPEVLSEWQGHRPSLPDSLPVIGRSPRFANVWFAFGHQHVGLTLGPLTGRLVADLVAGRDPGLDMAPYRPERRYA